MLLHTRVFGDYDGPEEVISRNNNYTEINVVDNYGKAAKTTFTVVDTDGTPQANLPVEFKIYNYAEFCTVVTKTTDENGQTWLTAGLGCMMAYAAKDGKFGFQVFKSGEKPPSPSTTSKAKKKALSSTSSPLPRPASCPK